ncbi:putative transfer inhibition protein [Citrobacter koseri]|nr:putative transfer inhibition protein [Citrobacter koseri]
MYLLCVFLVYRRWIAPLPVVGQLRNVGVTVAGRVRWPWCMSVYFCSGKALALPAEPFMTKLFADKSIPDVILTLLTIFILAPLNEETLFRGIMLNVFRSRYCWTMWLGALITSLLFVAAHSQYQNLLTLAELFLVGLITSVAQDQKWWPAAAGIAAYGSNHAGFTVWVESYIFIKHCALKPGVFF